MYVSFPVLCSDCLHRFPLNTAHGMIGARGIRDIGEICRNPQESQFAFQMSGSLGSSSVIKQCIVGKRLPRFSSRDNSLQLSNYNMHYLMTEWAMNNQHRRPSSRNRIPNKQTEQPWFFSAGFSDLSPGEENTPTWGEENIQLLIVLPRCCGFVRVHSPHQSWMTTEITIHGQYRVCIPRHSIKKEVKTVTGHSLLLELLVDIPSLFSFFRLLLKELVGQIILPSGLLKHGTLENLQTQWRFRLKAGKIIKLELGYSSKPHLMSPAGISWYIPLLAITSTTIWPPVKCLFV